MSIALLNVFGPTLSALLAISLIEFSYARSYTLPPLSFALVECLLSFISGLSDASALF
jgi:hypothetical protein